MADLPPDSDDIFPIKNLPRLAVATATTAVVAAAALVIGGPGLVYYFIPIAVSAIVLYHIFALKDRIAVMDQRLAEIRADVREVRDAIKNMAPPPTTADRPDPVENLVRTDDLMAAINLYREQTGAGLREARDAVEAMRSRI